MDSSNLTDAAINARLAELLGHYDKPLTEREINQALADAHLYVKSGRVYWRLNGNRYAFSVMDLLTPKKLWDRREGATYQADIAAHVLPQLPKIRPAPNWAGDLATAYTLKAEIAERQERGNFVNNLRALFEGRPGLPPFEVLFASARDIALAALRTLEEAKCGQ